MTDTAVETYLDTKVQPEHRDIVDALRRLMAECAPQAQETIMYGSLAWRGTKPLAIISAAKTHLTFAFERGAEFDDPFGLLDGVGKRTRHIKIKAGDDLDDVALRSYISQAVALDQS